MNNDTMNKEIFDMVKDNYKNNKINDLINNKYSLKRDESNKKQKAKNILNIKKLITLVTTAGIICISTSALVSNIEKLKTKEIIDKENNHSYSQNFDNKTDSYIEITDEENITDSIYKETFKNEDDKIYIKKEKEEQSSNSIFNVGYGYDDKLSEYYNDFVGSDADIFLQKYSKIYGVDYNLMVAIAMQESKLGHNLNNSCAIGFMQIEDTNRNGQDIVFNYEKECNEKIDYGYLSILEHNIQVSCMMMQDCINKSNGNIYMAIQGYNFGVTKMRQIANFTAKTKGCNTEDVCNDFSNIDWMNNIITCVGNNYGDPKYIENVLKYCKNSEISYYYDNKKYDFNLKTGEYSYNDLEKNKTL